MEFSRQEYWSVLPCPSPGDLPSPGIEPTSLVSLAMAGRFFMAEPPAALRYAIVTINDYKIQDHTP